MDKINIAGLGLGGGKRDNFFFCLLEYFPSSKRWFLKSLLQVKDGHSGQGACDGDSTLGQWAEEFELKQLVVDFPLLGPPCHRCDLTCPGMAACSVGEVVGAREQIERLLQLDLQAHHANPKRYEQGRLVRERGLQQGTGEIMLSRAFKRRLKQGFLPYWNRAIDVWVWENYYDHLLRYFGAGLDSFGHTSIMLMLRFAYLRRHLGESLNCYETSPLICLLELLRTGVISARQLSLLKDIELGASSRLAIAESVAKELNIFIYDHDLALIAKNPRAFTSFLLGVVGQRLVLKKITHIPKWCQPSAPTFVVPQFNHGV